MASSLPVWPQSLPAPDRDGYQYELDAGLVRTPFSGGTVRQRRTVWGLPAAFALSWRMNTAQLGVFQVFLDTYGYGWFAMDLVSGAARVIRPRVDCIDHKVRFIGNATHAMIGPNLWRVTIAAEVESMQDPRADSGAFVFEFVDDVKPEMVDELSDWDSLSL